MKRYEFFCCTIFYNLSSQKNHFPQEILFFAPKKSRIHEKVRGLSKKTNPLCENSDFATNGHFLHEKFVSFYLGEVRIHGYSCQLS